MYFVLDIVCVLILAGGMIRFWKASIPAVLIKAACVLLSAAIAVVASIPLTAVTNNFIVAPIMEKSAANRLADMVSADHKATGRETAAGLDLDELVNDCPPAFTDWVDRYHGDLATVCFAYRSADAKSMLVNLLSPLTHKVSRAASYLILWILVFLVLRYFVWRLEWNSSPPPRKKGDKKNAVPPLLGLLYGICIVWGIVVALQWLVPAFDGIAPLIKINMLTDGAVYPVLRIVDPLYWLAQI